jgi:putative two-component system hydrogenase maturation factor HypX/HoxX
LLVASAYNSMMQRMHAELADRGHEVSVELALGDEVMREGVRRYDPDLVIAPMLTTAIPADIWSSWPCFIIHLGPKGDRGPSSLDWVIMSGAHEELAHQVGESRQSVNAALRGFDDAAGSRCAAGP